MNNLWDSRKIASEAFYMDMVFPESSGEEEGKPKWKLKLAKPDNALPAPQATGRMRYYLFSYTASIITKPGRLGQQSMAMLRGKNANKTCFKSIVYKWNKYKTLEMKTYYYYKKHSTAEGLLWWQETQRPKQRDVQRELSLQSFGGRRESTMIQVISQGSIDQFDKLII